MMKQKKLQQRNKKASDGNDAGFFHRNNEFLQGQRSHGTARTDSHARVPAGLRWPSLL
jgi:hypothetical protein